MRLFGLTQRGRGAILSGIGLSSYSATVDWGDGQSDASAVIRGPVNGVFTVTDSHTYSQASAANTVTVVVGRAGAPDSAAVTDTVATSSTISPTLVLTNDVYVISTSASSSVSAAQGLLANDTPADALTVTAATVTGQNGGTFVFSADGSFTYTPPASFVGFDRATYTAADAQGDSKTATVTVLSQPAGVVWKFYEAVLNRNPDDDGLKYWINDITSGGKTGDIAFGFFESDELLDKIIGGYYTQFLQRTLDADGLAYWKSVWHANGGPEQIKAGFAASPEFYKSSGGTPDGWIEALYTRILGRPSDPQGKVFWLNYYQQQTSAGADPGVTKQQIALAFLESKEDFGEDVTGWFNEYLQRAPTTSELAQYVSEMLAGGTDRQIEQEITNLPEYGQEPPASPAGTANPLPNYLVSPASKASLAARDALFASLSQ